MTLNKPFLAAIAGLVIALLLTSGLVFIPLGLWLTAQPCMAVRALGYLLAGTGSLSLLQLHR